MTVFYTLAQSGYDNLPPTFAVIVDDGGFEYVWAKDIKKPPFTAESRIELAYPDGEPDGLTIEDYKQLAFFNVGGYFPSEWTEAKSGSVATKEAKAALNDPRYLDKRAELANGPDPSDRIQSQINSSADQLRFHAEDFDDEDSLNADQMAMFVLGAVGGASPDGPNGWLVRSIMGEEPQPGDEKGFVNFDEDAPVAAEEGTDE